MGYGLVFPANQLGNSKILWGIREYGSIGVWVKRVSTVCTTVISMNNSVIFSPIVCKEMSS
jgi:hypothetical protein